MGPGPNLIKQILRSYSQMAVTENGKKNNLKIVDVGARVFHREDSSTGFYKSVTTAVWP